MYLERDELRPQKRKVGKYPVVIVLLPWMQLVTELLPNVATHDYVRRLSETASRPFLQLMPHLPVVLVSAVPLAGLQVESSPWKNQACPVVQLLFVLLLLTIVTVEEKVYIFNTY